MAKLTIGFGLLLILLGIVGFFMTGGSHPTALIPVWFGIVLGVCGALARTEDARRRMLWMHIAVTIGLVGFLFPGIMAIKEWASAHGAALAHPAAVGEQGAMAIICFLFVIMCVRSFVVARRGRTEVEG